MKQDWEIKIENDTRIILLYIDNYIKQNNNIQTGGAITIPLITTKVIEDGDITLRINIPYASYNKFWFNSVFSWIEKFRKESTHKPDSIYLESDCINIYINIHSCNPD